MEMAMDDKTACERGFTLLEVMIALLIFSIGSMALSKGMSQVVGQQRRLEEKTFASWIAKNKYNELSAISSFPDIGEKNEDIEFADRDWLVEEKIIKTPNPFMRRVEITVFLLKKEDNSKNPIHSITGFIGDV
jgi:general secretion pathway protein I